MQAHSAAFTTAMKDAQRVEHVRGTVGAVSFNDSNIIALNYSNACADGKDVRFGSARIGQLDIKFCNLGITRGEWRGRQLVLEYGLQLADGTTEYIPCGSFTIAKADWTDTGVNITAYDCLAGFDVPFTASTTSGYIFDLLELAETLTGITNGRTSAECSRLPNGREYLGLYPQNDIKTVRDFISWAASAVGGFVTAGRDGSFLVRSFAESELVDTFQSRDRVVGSIFSDYVTNYDGISITNTDGSIQYYSSEASTGGASIAVGANPLLQYGVDEVKTRQRQALAEVAHGIAYTPFNIAILNCPVYDLGDIVRCEGGVAGGSVDCCVMGIEWTFKNTTTLKGFGADPNLAAGKSATDKALQGMASKTKENELVIHTYINASDYELEDAEEQTVIDIDFATIKAARVTMQHEINLDLLVADDKATVTALYYLNDVLEYYQPVDTFSESGKHIISLMYFLETLSEGTSYEWKVKLRIDGGTGTIDRGDVHAWLQGQGLVALNDFDGLIELEDTYTPITGGQDIIGLSDSVISIERDMPYPNISLADTFTAYIGGQEIVGLADSVRLRTAYEIHTRITEDGDVRITMDGDTRTTEGGYQ
jgi:hypothetical protein